MILTFVSLGLLAAAAVFSVRWMLARYDTLGRINPFPSIRVGLALSLALASAVPVVMYARLENRLEAAASQLAGAPVTVHCQTFGETWTEVGAELGFVRWGPDGVPEHRTVLKYGPCHDLAAWLRSDRASPSLDQVIAVHVLAHESMHMSGITDESHTECAALQRDTTLAMLLGADRGEAARLTRQYWLQVYPRMPDGYRTGECTPGGKLDERRDGAPWADVVAAP